MNLPGVDSINAKDKRVLVRGDLDIDINLDDNPKRLATLVITLNKLLENGAVKIVIIGHRGRPDGKKVVELSNKPLVDYFSSKLKTSVGFAEEVERYHEFGEKIILLENLRFWPGEEDNAEEFSKKLSLWGEVYINDAFGVSHREHASIVGIPKLLPHAAGLRFSQEVLEFTAIRENPKRPLIIILSGAKKDKLDYLDKLIGFSDKLLIGGRLPEYMGDEYNNEKVVVARLIQDKEDITIHSIETFEKEIANAGSIIVNGPVGKFEDPGHRQGTERVFKAIADSSAYKLAGGGDTEEALSILGLEDKFDWISTGGGAMLDLLATGTLPGIEALK